MPGTDPDRASYQIAVETSQNLLTTARNITGPDGDLTGDIGRAILANLHGPRRPRVCARNVNNGRRFGEELLRSLREGPPWPTLDTVTRRLDSLQKSPKVT